MVPPPDQTEDSGELRPRPLDLHTPQFTLRAVLTGMVLAAVLSTCNIYVGLLIGWSINMSIVAALLSYGFWMGLHGLSGGRVRRWELLENNINQTACSAGASIASAGLIAPIPALAIMTGTTLTWHYLALWVLSVALVGIMVAVLLRRQMLLWNNLPFPMGIASAVTLREMYARGREAVRRVLALGAAALAAATVTLTTGHFGVSPLGLPFALHGFSARTLTLALDPSLLMVGVGGLIGLRAGVSLALGALLAYAVCAPRLIATGKLELVVAESLHTLPDSVKLSPELAAHATYNADRRLLEWKGVMSAAQRAALLALSDDARYREAVQKLYGRSQLELAVPLGTAPAAESLAGLPLEYDAERKVLRATAALDRAAVARLAGTGELHAAAETLAAWFDYTTTQELQIGAPLADFPRHFGFPHNCRGLVTYDRAQLRLVVQGPLSATQRAALLQAADAWETKHPRSAPQMSAFRAAVESLHARSSSSFMPSGATLPAELAGRVTYDDDTKTLQAHGVLSTAEIATLRAVSPDPDYQAAVTRLVAGTRYRPISPNFRDMLQWLLYPGVTLMVVSSLVSFAFSWRSVAAALTGFGRRSTGPSDLSAAGDVTPRWLFAGLLSALLLSVVLQVSFFQILWWAAIFGVLISVVLAIVAARVSGETGITPVGTMGKVTQLVFGVLTPGSAATNLMSANVAGGAASQCADLLHDLKCGHLLGAAPKWQTLAQVLGVLAGTLTGSAVYLFMFPNPSEQLLTPEWPAPAVAAWKAVAELFQTGFGAIPEGTGLAMIIAAGVGVLFPILEHTLPGKARRFLPSCASLGLGLVIPAWNSLSMLAGGIMATALGRWCPRWSKRYWVALCAGIVAGESLTGVGQGLWQIVKDRFL
jgi:uncharacterized oligopeptide transporter (OPT) family protein